MRTSLKLMLLVGFCVLSVLQAKAYDFEVDGLCYTITSPSRLEVELSYPGYNRGNSGNITVPSSVIWQNRKYSVTAMGENTFSRRGNYNYCDNEDLLSVIIPQSVTDIKAKAFYRCSRLKRILLPRSITTVRNQAFYGCSNLLEVFCMGAKCPEGLIAGDRFEDCNPYLEFYVPSVKEYGLGIEYVSINNNNFTYSGARHHIDASNNLLGYSCSIESKETEVNVGTYTDTLKVTYGDGLDFTVDIPFEYTIAPAPLTAQIDDVTREYGDANPQFNCKLSGFVNNESLDTEGISLAFECEATQNSPAGEYPIRASVDAKNYDVTYSYGTLTINKAPLSMSVPNVTKVYGMQNPEFNIVYNGLKNNEVVPEWITAPSISTSATAASPVGEYDVTINGADPRNYNVTAVHNGKLTVTPKDAVVKVKNYTRCYGQQNPEFDCEYIGLITGESSDFLLQEPSISTVATFDSPVGVYEIVAADAVAKNYSFAYESGLLTITKAPQKIEWKQSFDNIKPGTKVELTAQSSSELPVAFESLKQSVATIETEGEKVYVHFLAPGSVTLQASQTGNENYEPAEAAYVNVTVIQDAESIALSETELTLDEYDTFTLIAEVHPSTTTDKGVAWSSSDETVATVTNGLVRAVNQGSAVITAKTTDGTNLAATCDVRVVKPVIGIIVEPAAIEIEAGKTATIVAGAVPSNATNTKLLWASENETVATVTQQGVVTAIAEGETKISVSATDGSGVQAFCDVKVKPEESGIRDVTVGDDLVTVYATDGTCVMRNVIMSEVYRLHPGVYLIRTSDGMINKIAVK